MNRSILALPLIALLCSGCIPWGRTVRAPAPDYEPLVDGPPQCDQRANGRHVLDSIGIIGAATGTLFALLLASEGFEPGAMLTIAAIGGGGVWMHGRAIQESVKRTESCREAAQLWQRLEQVRPPNPYNL